MLRGKGGIDGHIDCSQDQCGEVYYRPLPAVLRKQGDAITLDDSPGEEGVRHCVDAGQELTVEIGCQFPDASCHRTARWRLLAATKATTSTRVSSVNMKGIVNSSVDRV